MLAERMRRTILEAEETGSRVGLMLLDIDRFKDINDSLGHDRGDELLEQVAERLRGALRDEDIVARLGGDEFAILLPDVRSVANAERLARRVRGLFVPPFMLGELPAARRHLGRRRVPARPRDRPVVAHAHRGRRHVRGQAPPHRASRCTRPTRTTRRRPAWSCSATCTAR